MDGNDKVVKNRLEQSVFVLEIGRAQFMQIREKNEIFLLFISIRVFFALHAKKKSETNRNLC